MQRELPKNVELEQTLVSQAMQSREAFGEASEIVPHEDRFSHAGCRTIWRALRELNAKGEPWDLPLLAAYLGRTHQLADAGGYAAITDIFSKSLTTTQAAHYAVKVNDLWQLRAMVLIGQDMARDAAEMSGGTAEEIRAKYEQQLFGLAENGLTAKAITSKELSEEVEERMQRIMNGEKAGFATGFIDIDNVFNGMTPKSVTLLAGRPGGGKTKLAVNVAQYLAEQGTRIAFYSLEMANVELGLRVATAISGIDSHLMLHNRLTREQWQSMLAANSVLAKYPIYWQDKPGLRPTELIASLRRMKRRHGIQLAIVDHILLMQPDQRMGRSRNDEVGDISRMVKLAAKEIDIPILALCQMNRGIEGRNDAPRLSDLRDSGNLEQDADNVIFLHKPKEEAQGDIVDIYIAKQRNGPTGKCSLFDRKGVFRFENAAMAYL